MKRAKKNECFKEKMTRKGREENETRSRRQGKAKCFENVCKNARESSEKTCPFFSLEREKYL